MSDDSSDNEDYSSYSGSDDEVSDYESSRKVQDYQKNLEKIPRKLNLRRPFFNFF